MIKTDYTLIEVWAHDINTMTFETKEEAYQTMLEFDPLIGDPNPDPMTKEVRGESWDFDDNEAWASLFDGAHDWKIIEHRFEFEEPRLPKYNKVWIAIDREDLEPLLIARTKQECVDYVKEELGWSSSQVKITSHYLTLSDLFVEIKEQNDDQ